MINRDLLENLRVLFNPKTVAVIGASENPGKLGSHVMQSLTQGNFDGTILPINPSSSTIMGIKAFPSITAFEGPIDAAIIVLPAKLVPGIFEECIQKKTKGIVLVTAGFKEIDDPSGAELQKILAELANKAGMPVIGPNTFGMVNLHHNLNASFTPQFCWVKKGRIALVSQSGGISHLTAFMAMRQHIGMSKIVGLGNRLNVDFAEIVAYLMGDPDTRIIMLYLEGLDEPRRLIDVAGEHRGKKPIIAYKTGSAEAGDRASVSHTGSMAGKHEIYEGALKQVGILCLDNIETLLDTARALDMCPLPQGRKVAILSGQAGPGMAACDVCEAEGLEI
ncbi:MAG: CoA-binding protein, partial [Desulfobacteraceae bacterium]